MICWCTARSSPRQVYIPSRTLFHLVIRILKLKFPPVLKVLVRGYLIIMMLVALWYFDLIQNLGLIIFSITTVSISMIFGVGYLLINLTRPVRRGNCDIPNTALIFVKGAMVIYFISLLGTFDLLPLEITGLLMTGVAFALALFGTLSYILEVFERVTPVKKTIRRQASRPTKRTVKPLSRPYLRTSGTDAKGSPPRMPRRGQVPRTR